MSFDTVIDLYDISIGDKAATQFVVSAESIDAFARLSLDDNKLHMNQEFAKRCGFDGRIAHGMIALNAISRLIGTQLPGHGSLIVSQDVQFVQPILPGDSLEATVNVERVSHAARTVIMGVNVINVATSVVILRGIVRVHAPQHVSAAHHTTDLCSNGGPRGPIPG